MSPIMAIDGIRCYLCGDFIALGDQYTEDHVLPKQFIRRTQPKAKGYQYADKIPTHQACNNEFERERFCQRAAALIPLLLDLERTPTFIKKSNPGHRIVALNAELLPTFGPAELKYFGMIDAREVPYETFTSDEFIIGKPKVIPMKKPAEIWLSVIVKTACAFLIKKGAIEHPTHWRVLVLPFIDEERTFNLEDMFGPMKPFDDGLYIWSGPTEAGDGAAIFRHGSLVTWVLVTTSRDRTFWNRFVALGEATVGHGGYVFNGKSLLELVTYDWWRRDLGKEG